MAEMEEKLFGARPKNPEDLTISDKDFVPIKTGVEGYKLLKYGPKHIMNADQYEPLYIHQENILEDCLTREAERVAYQHNLMNRVVFDSITDSKLEPKPVEETKEQQVQPKQDDPSNPLNLPTLNNCDNCAIFEDYYKP
jgi:hypothetical protein